MRCLSTATLVLLALAVPNLGVKLFLQKYQPVKSSVRQTLTVQRQHYESKKEATQIRPRNAVEAPPPLPPPPCARRQTTPEPPCSHYPVPPCGRAPPTPAPAPTAPAPVVAPPRPAQPLTPAPPQYTWLRNSDVARALKVIGVSHNFDNDPGRSRNRMANTAHRLGQIKSHVLITENADIALPVRKYSAAASLTDMLKWDFPFKYKRVSDLGRSAPNLQTKETLLKDTVKTPAQQYVYRATEENLHKHRPMGNKVMETTTQFRIVVPSSEDTDAGSQGEGSEWHLPPRRTTTPPAVRLAVHESRDQNADTEYLIDNNVKSNVIFVNKGNTTSGPLKINEPSSRRSRVNQGLSATPPRLLHSIGGAFGLDAQRTWDGIKDVFSGYYNGDGYSAPPPAPEPVPLTNAQDARLDLVGLAKKNGYRVEEHTVRTQDGYELTLHRLHARPTRARPQAEAGDSRPVVFLMHGLLDSADSWVLQGRGRALGYLLADAGCDVWLGNARGNKYSLKHATYSSTQPEFWKFTWEEIGLYDLSAMIDYTLMYVGVQKVYYVGHSQGTTCFFVLTSMQPAYNEKVEMMFALSPVAYMNHIKSPIVQLFSPAHELLSFWFSSLNVYAPLTDSINRIMELFCYFLPRCDGLVSMLVGSGSHIERSLLPVVFAHMPTGSSTLQFMHYAQLTQSGLFNRYDYGKDVNLEVYGNIYPPEYELHNVVVPMVLFYSDGDWLAAPQDVQTLKEKLPTTTKEYYINDFNHLDFMYASAAKELIYDHIIRIIQKAERTLHQ